ncbi:MAG: CHAT domain-containing protein, partial [Mesoflavibacter sp.]|nr:CHAT domain-containing protein [Mesoflavibacter sp.]
PLVEAFAALGGRVELEILGEPTLAGLSGALATAKHPYHVVHFDGHGIYSRKRGLGALCFEHPADAEKLDQRRSVLVTADELAEVMREHRVPLVFLEACQSAKADEDPSASVAGRLLRGGVASVLAMSHSVLVATAERFVKVFYGQLSSGATVGASMLAAQRRLRDDPSRGHSFFGELKLADWFVPVLYQEQVDPQLVRELPGQLAREDIILLGRKAVEGLPPSPEHGFVGRSRELLKIERLLMRERFAVLVGEGGEGKTTLAVELARWLVSSRRFDKAAFVSVEDSLVRDARAVLSVLAEQLVPGFEAETDFERVWRLVERRLRDRPTLLVFDNMESVLPPVSESGSLGLFEPEILEGILQLATRCTRVASTRVVFTSRSELPASGKNMARKNMAGRNTVRIGRLEPSESVAIVAQVLGISGEVPLV